MPYTDIMTESSKFFGHLKNALVHDRNITEKNRVFIRLLRIEDCFEGSLRFIANGCAVLLLTNFSKEAMLLCFELSTAI